MERKEHTVVRLWEEEGGQLLDGEDDRPRQLLTPPGFPPLCVIPGWKMSAESRAESVALCWLELVERREGEEGLRARFRTLLTAPERAGDFTAD